MHVVYMLLVAPESSAVLNIDWVRVALLLVFDLLRRALLRPEFGRNNCPNDAEHHAEVDDTRNDKKQG